MRDAVLSPHRGRRILVTGGSGFLGAAVVEEGVALGAEMHTLGLAGRPAGVPGVTAHVVDIRDSEAVIAVVRQVRPEAVMHLAAQGVSGASQSMPELVAVNAGGLAILLEALAEGGRTPPVIIAGSGFEYEASPVPISENAPIAPSTKYGASKAAATNVASAFASALPITVLRLFGLYGPGERLPRLAPWVVAKAKKGEPVDLTRGEQVRDFLFVRDAAESFWAALEAPNTMAGLRILNVGSGRGVPLRDYVDALAAALSRCGVVPRLNYGAVPYRAGEPMHYVAEISKALETLKWHPRTTLEDGTRETVEKALGTR